jgi:putative two-component system response regulator
MNEQLTMTNAFPPPPLKRLQAARDNTVASAPRIMIVDDVPLNIRVLQAHLAAAGYREFTTITDSSQALAAMYRDVPDLMILDIMMPEVSGLEILEAARSDPHHARMPILVVTGADSRELKRQALELGATDFLTKPVDAEELLPRVRNVLAVRTYEVELERRVRERTEQLELARKELVLCLARASEYRDNETGNHVLRVGCYAAIIADQLGFDSEHVTMIQQAATLHDLGKIAVPDAILRKPGKLTPDEFRLMQTHCGLGKAVCHPMSASEFEVFSAHAIAGSRIVGSCMSPLVKMAASIALTHHERWDGSGYPLALAGESIPIEGRITAVADVFDALNSRRPYKPAFPMAQCFTILRAKRGTHFDPAVLDAFFAREADIVAIQVAYADA